MSDKEEALRKKMWRSANCYVGLLLLMKKPELGVSDLSAVLTAILHLEEEMHALTGELRAIYG